MAGLSSLSVATGACACVFAAAVALQCELCFATDGRAIFYMLLSGDNIAKVVMQSI